MFRKAFYYITHWEAWHWFAKYIIIGPVWLWLCIKAKSLWFFTPSNPGIVFGGFLGETKKEIYDQLPDGSYPTSIFIDPKQNIIEVEQSIVLSGLRYPLAVKPNAGMMGYMFRKIESRDQLRQYHAAMKVEYVAQQFCDLPIEVSVFYYRFPGKTKGEITGLVRKDCMYVTGDGTSTLRQLILQYPRAQFRQKELFNKHAGNLNDVLRPGETYILSDALNLSRGGNLVNLEHEKDARLLKIFDDLSHYTNFYYGRYDIKCSSVEDIKQGNFVILEFNGCGGEAHHVYSGFSFFQACRILIQHWVILYEISLHNRNNGILPWNHNEGAEFMANTRKHFSDLKQLDSVFSFKAGNQESVARTILPNLQKHVA
jgi:hypothetical protein